MKVLGESHLREISGGNAGQVSELSPECRAAFDDFSTIMHLSHTSTITNVLKNFIQKCSVPEMEFLENKIEKARSLADKLFNFR